MKSTLSQETQLKFERFEKPPQKEHPADLRRPTPSENTNKEPEERTKWIYFGDFPKRPKTNWTAEQLESLWYTALMRVIDIDDPIAQQEAYSELKHTDVYKAQQEEMARLERIYGKPKNFSPIPFRKKRD